MEELAARDEAGAQWAMEFANSPDTFGLFTDEFLAAAASIAHSAQTHLDLAIAYREMGLDSSAALEAAEALRRAELSRTRADLALTMLFGRKVLLVSVEEALSFIRESHFVN